MDEMPSSEFRRRYATLTKPTKVTANGHGIGEWYPYLSLEPHRFDAYRTNSHESVPVDVETAIRSSINSAIAKEGATLEAMLVDEHFNRRPFTPAPKKGK